MDKQKEFIEAVELSFGNDSLKKLVFSRPTVGEIQKISARLVLHKGRRLLAVEYSLPGNTVSHKNIYGEEIKKFLAEGLAGYAQANLITTLGECEWKISKSGKVALLGYEKLVRRINEPRADFVSAVESLDKVKDRMLTGNEIFLKKLGVSDASGRVHDKKQGKFRQINRFLEYIEGIYCELPADGELTVLDLCSGKSYLSFAVYHYLTEIKERRVRMTCVDLKRDVIDWCREMAKEIGFAGMHFITEDVRNTVCEGECHMVISLHACDVATDIVLAQAVRLGARVILSTPCCHRYLRDKINARELLFVAENPHVFNKLSEAMTDSLRVLMLKSRGYETVATELTDPDDTPKNTLIRAVKRKPYDAQATERYGAALRFLLGEGAMSYLKEFEL